MTILFTDGAVGSTQETAGTFAAWTGTVVTAGTAYANDTTAPHHGTKNFRYYTPAGTAAGSFCSSNWQTAAQATLYVRVMNLRFDVLPEDNGDRHYVCGFYYNSGSTALGRFGIIKNGTGNYKWIIRGISSGTTFTDYQGANTPAVNTNYCCEYQSTVANGTGIYRLWVNGDLEIEATSLDNDARANNYLVLGTISSDTPDLSNLNVYADCVVVADAYIGPELEGIQKFCLLNEMGY